MRCFSCIISWVEMEKIILEENKNCWLHNECNHIDCDKFCLRRFKLDYLYNEAMLSNKQRARIPLRYDNDCSDKESFEYLSTIEKNILNFVKDGGSLYIYSSTTGNGKTSWAIRMIQSYLNKIWYESELTCRALFINVPRYLLAIKDNISQKSDYVAHIKENVLNADLVVWDEVGTKGLTQFEHENILNLINARIDLGKANIYTSNLSDDELHVAVGDRLYSRIAILSDGVELVGSDKRAL